MIIRHQTWLADVSAGSGLSLRKIAERLGIGLGTLARRLAQTPFGTTQQSPPATSPPGAMAPSELALLLQSYGGLVVNALNTTTPGYVLAEDISRPRGE